MTCIVTMMATCVTMTEHIRDCNTDRSIEGTDSILG